MSIKLHTIEAISLTPEQFRSISQTERASGVAAIVKQRWFNLEEIQPKDGLCWIAVENIRSCGNLGSLIRTSEAVGGAGFILIGNSIDPFEPDVIRSSMSGVFNQKLSRTNMSALQQWIESHHIQVIGASPDGTNDLHQFKYAPSSSLLFLGEERLGLTEKQRSLCQHLIRIPMVGQADSLNLGVAGSLLLYEIYRSKR